MPAGLSTKRNPQAVSAISAGRRQQIADGRDGRLGSGPGWLNPLALWCPPPPSCHCDHPDIDQTTRPQARLDRTVNVLEENSDLGLLRHTHGIDQWVGVLDADLVTFEVRSVEDRPHHRPILLENRTDSSTAACTPRKPNGASS